MCRVLSFVLNLATTTETYEAVLILPSQIQSLTRRLVSYIYYSTTFTHPMRRRNPKTMKKFSRTRGFLSNPARPDSPRHCYGNVV